MTATPVPPVTEDAPVLYAVLAQELPADAALTTLHIGGSHTTLASGQAGAAPLLRCTLDLGARVTAATGFAHETPQPEELHAAALAALAVFAPLRAQLAPDSALYTADAGIRHIALAAGLEAMPEMELPLAAVEQVFGQLLGDGAPADGEQLPLPAQARFAACVVILRACMGALGFERIAIRSDAVA